MAYEINVNINEGGKTPTRNPSNPTTENGQKLTKQQAGKQLKENRKTTKTSDNSRTLNADTITNNATKGIATATLAVRFANAYTQTNYAIRGADHKAEKQQQRVNQVTVGAIIIGATIRGAKYGPWGAAIAGAAATAAVAYQQSQINKKFLKEIQVDNTQSLYYQNRVIQNMSEKR